MESVLIISPLFWRAGGGGGGCGGATRK